MANNYVFRLYFLNALMKYVEDINALMALVILALGVVSSHGSSMYNEVSVHALINVQR